MTTDWNPVLRGEFGKPYWKDLQDFVAIERAAGPVYPPHEAVFAALHLTPSSLVNIYQELHDDLAVEIPDHGNLEAWARQGVLLLNATLTVRAGQAASHQGKGWETFTDTVLQAVSAKSEHVVFILWGSNARKKRALIDVRRHTIIESAHPSPLSAHNGFFATKPFSRTNQALTAHNQRPIDWAL